MGQSLYVKTFFLSIAYLIVLCWVCCSAHADNRPLKLFSLADYDQHIADWHFTHTTLLLSKEAQKHYSDDYKQHYVGQASPWSKPFIEAQINDDTMDQVERQLLSMFNNTDKRGATINYGENFRAYSTTWIHAISHNIPLHSLNHLRYHAEQRAIVTRNVQTRVLPTTDPVFHHYSYAGQGYPFDRLQMSALWVGTPVYVVVVSNDKRWVLVITPSYNAWVKASGIAYVSDHFIQKWTDDVYHHGLAAIIKTKAGIYNQQKTALLQTAYIGTVLPKSSSAHDASSYDMPMRDRTGHAKMVYAFIDTHDIATMPYPATQHHIAQIMEALIHRPYGWGGMYFYNDCSQELKGLFAVFGIWLPRDARSQIDPITLDLSGIKPKTLLNILQSNRYNITPFMSIAYIGGHVIMLLGNHHDPQDMKTSWYMSYQNMWGVHSSDDLERYVVGQSVLFPLLTHYPQYPYGVPQLNYPYFKVRDLTQNIPDSSSIHVYLQQLNTRLRMLSVSQLYIES